MANSGQISISFTGLDTLAENFRRSPKIVEEAVKRALGKALAHVEMEAKKRAPVDTGYLQGSIGGEGGYRFLHGLTAGVGTNVEYALIQELGEKFRHPKTGQAHYMEHGARAAAPAIKDEFEAAMQEVANQLTQ